jgi:hypothetical protein
MSPTAPAGLVLHARGGAEYSELAAVPAAAWPEIWASWHAALWELQERLERLEAGGERRAAAAVGLAEWRAGERELPTACELWGAHAREAAVVREMQAELLAQKARVRALHRAWQAGRLREEAAGHRATAGKAEEVYERARAALARLYGLPLGDTRLEVWARCRHPEHATLFEVGSHAYTPPHVARAQEAERLEREAAALEGPPEPDRGSIHVRTEEPRAGALVAAARAALHAWPADRLHPPPHAVLGYVREEAERALARAASRAVRVEGLEARLSWTETTLDPRGCRVEYVAAR